MNPRPILHLEDDDNDVLLLQLAFAEKGITHPMHRVRDGLEAIAYLSGEGEYADRARFPLPCLALLDLKTPRCNGLEVLAWIREHPSLCRMIAIMLTASANQSDVDDAYRMGVNAFLVKPSGFDELLALAGSLADFWLVRNHFASGGCSAE